MSYNVFHRPILEVLELAYTLRVKGENTILETKLQGLRYHTYVEPSSRILSFGNNAPSFLITGCQGGGIPGNQISVARAMINLQLETSSQERAGILLGDNFYDHGVISERDSLFEDAFYKIYKGLDIPFFNILGNHDYNFHSLSNVARGSVHKMKRAMAQVNHTYSNKVKYGFPSWVMPSRYYALNFNNANFFMLDSNTFCFDAGQRQWLENVYIKLNPKLSNKWNILVMHHPLVSYGKRHPGTQKDSDITNYMLPEYDHHIETLNSTMNQWIFETLWSIDITFDLQLCAHDHFLGLSEINGNPYSQKQYHSPYKITQQVRQNSSSSVFNPLMPDSFIPAPFDDVSHVNQKSPYKNMLEKPKMFQALVGGGGANPSGLKNEKAAIWTKEHLGFLDLKIGDNLELNFHHRPYLGEWEERNFIILSSGELRGKNGSMQNQVGKVSDAQKTTSSTLDQSLPIQQSDATNPISNASDTLQSTSTTHNPLDSSGNPKNFAETRFAKATIADRIVQKKFNLLMSQRPADAVKALMFPNKVKIHLSFLCYNARC